MLTVRIVEGASVLADDRLDGLLRDAPAPARPLWLRSWAAAYPDHHPWAVLVEDGADLAAAALLARTRVRGVTRVVLLGHGPSDYARLPARDDPAGRALSRGLVAAIGGLRGPWEVRLDGLPPGDPVARGLAGGLARAGIGRGKSSPIVRFSKGRELRPYLGQNLHRKDRKMRNRARADGLDLEVAHHERAVEVEAILPEMEAVHRRRDAAMLRRSDLEDPRATRFWRGAIVALVGAGEAEVTTIRLGGRLAAYVVGLVDPPHYRLWDSRFDPDLERYSPGTLGLLEAIGRALADERFEAFDFMRGVLGYKMELANDMIETEYLRAWSSTATQLAMTAPEKIRRGLVAVKRRSPAVAAAWRRAKRLGRRG